jgi:hypothetical protein
MTFHNGPALAAPNPGEKADSQQFTFSEQSLDPFFREGVHAACSSRRRRSPHRAGWGDADPRER